MYLLLSDLCELLSIFKFLTSFHFITHFNPSKTVDLLSKAYSSFNYFFYQRTPFTILLNQGSHTNWKQGNASTLPTPLSFLAFLDRAPHRNLGAWNWPTPGWGNPLMLARRRPVPYKGSCDTFISRHFHWITETVHIYFCVTSDVCCCCCCQNGCQEATKTLTVFRNTFADCYRDYTHVILWINHPWRKYVINSRPFLVSSCGVDLNSYIL